MKKLYFLLPLLFLLACSNDKNSSRLFTPGMLARQLFSIDASRDTSLATLHGAVIRIASGSFTTSGNIQLEIKEAFTPAEMIAAGLVTESNGRPLRSGGMIYINAIKKGEAVELIKPIRVSIPNPYYDSAMQVFKGIATDSAGINWVESSPVDSTPQSAKWAAGKELFRRKCTSCHRLFTDLTGPALANVENRGPWSDRKKIYEYLSNTDAFMAKDNYTRRLKARFGSVMPGFDMPFSEMNIIFDYIKNESKRPGAKEEEKDYRDSLDRARRENNPVDTAEFNSPVKKPCGDDTLYLPLPKQDQSFFEGDTSFSNPADTSYTSPTGPRYLDDPADRSTQFTDANPTGGMYDFEIQTFGWYNVDAFMEGYAGTTVVKVWAQVQTDPSIELHMYLFCPDKQLLSVGYERQGDKYFFDKINGGVPLFVNDRAVLFAFGSKGDNMYYGISEFIIKAEQTIPVKIVETTDEEIRKALRSKQLNGIDLGIEKKEKVIVSRPCDDTLPAVADSTAKPKK